MAHCRRGTRCRVEPLKFAAQNAAARAAPGLDGPSALGHPYKLWLRLLRDPVNTTGCYGKEKSNQK